MAKLFLNEGELLPIGFTHGCFTVIADFSAYQQECAGERIAKFEEEKQKFINGEKSTWHNFEDVETFDRYIAAEKEKKVYKIQCKCGKTYFRPAEFILRKRWRDCSEDCGIKLQKEAEMIASYPRVESSSYNITFVNNTHESLNVLECIDDHVEGEPIIQDKRKKGAGEVRLYKKFRCKCYLCGKEYEFLSSDFVIRNDTYGSRASLGYYCDASCDCHKISSFQWRTIQILKEYNIPYKVEVSFPDLLSEKSNPLRFDFLILNPDGTIKCLMECQGEQHFKLVSGYGGYASLRLRQERDQKKRDYAQAKNIPLIEIPYTYNTYEKECAYLKEVGII